MITNEGRFLTFSDRGHDLLDEPALHETVKTIKEDPEHMAWVTDDFSTEWEIIIPRGLRAITTSDELKLLTPEEQHKVQAIGSSQKNWQKLGDNDPEALFPDTPKIIGEANPRPFDTLLLSGVTLLDIHRVGAQAMLEDYQKYGFSGKLQFANFIGAMLVHQEMQRGNAGAASYTSPDSGNSQIQKIISVGSNFHGDFMMWQHTRHRGAWIDPFGTEQQFGPRTDPDIIRRYHSIEPNLAIAALKHLDTVYSPQEQIGIIRTIAEAHQQMTETTDEPKILLYADYGINSEDLDIQLMVDSFNEMPNTPSKNQVWTDLRVSPNQNELLRVETIDGVFTLKNNLIVHPGRGIEIPDCDIPAFLLALLKQSFTAQGRTSDGQILNILHARYQMLTGQQ